MSGSRFRTSRHALDALETFPNQYDNFYFSSKNHDFRKFLKILRNPGNPLICVPGDLPRVSGLWSLEGSDESSRGDGVGPRGRRRRPRVQKHVRNVASGDCGVPTAYRFAWRLETRSILVQDTQKRPSEAQRATSFVTALTWPASLTDLDILVLRVCEKITFRTQFRSNERN